MEAEVGGGGKSEGRWDLLELVVLDFIRRRHLERLSAIEMSFTHPIYRH